MVTRVWILPESSLHSGWGRDPAGAAATGGVERASALLAQSGVEEPGRYLSALVHSTVDRALTGFGFPVVPQGQARIRVQLSAAHSEDDVRACVAAFVAARAEVLGS